MPAQEAVPSLIVQSISHLPRAAEAGRRRDGCGVPVKSRITLGVAGILLLGLTVLRAVECWSTDSHLDHVAGVWVAGSIDLTRGVFYWVSYVTCGYGWVGY